MAYWGQSAQSRLSYHFVIFFWVFTLVFINANYATAKTGDNIKGNLFETVFSESFGRLVKGLLAKKCIGTVEGRTTDLTFAGILPANPHLSESQTLHINALTQKWIRNHHGNYINISSSQELGTLAFFDYTSPSELHKTILHHMKNAPLFLLVTTKRPFPDILQLKMVLYGRKAGSAFCNGEEAFYVHMPTHKVITLSDLTPVQRGTAGHYIDASKAYRYGLKTITRSLKDTKIVSVLPSFEDKKPCSWHNREIDLFDTQYFALKTEFSQKLNHDTGQLPRFKKLPSHYSNKKLSLPLPVPETMLKTYWSKPDISGRIIQLTFSVYIQGDLDNKVSFFSITDKAHYPNCSVIKPKLKIIAKNKKVVKKVKEVKAKTQSKPVTKPLKTVSIPVVQSTLTPKLSFYSEKRFYRKGEAARFIIESNVQCRLTLVNIDNNGISCLLFPHKDLPDTVLRPGQKFIFPPLGQLTLNDPGEETYIALCNPTASDISNITRNTKKIDCSKKRNDKTFDHHVNEIATFSANAPTLTAPFKRQDRLLRSKISVSVR